MGLQEVKDLGRDRGPGGPGAKPESTVSKDDRTRGCSMCGCGNRTRGRFAMGHDMAIHRLAREYVRGGRELNEEQLAYVCDETDKSERAKARVEREEQRAEEATK